MAPGGGIADILGSKGGRPKRGLGGGGGPLITPNGGGGGRRSGGGPRIAVLGGGAGLGKRKACCRAILKDRELMVNVMSVDSIIHDNVCHMVITALGL